MGYNLFAYCNDNPVMYSDPSGEWFMQLFCKSDDDAIDLSISFLIFILTAVHQSVVVLITR